MVRLLLEENLLQDYELEKLREAIGYVPQDHFLFSATVGENIAFTNPYASKEEIYEAAKLAIFMMIFSSLLTDMKRW